MVLTAAQTNAFFTEPTQMGIVGATFAAMAGEGIMMVCDLINFDKDTVKVMAKNLCNGGNHAFGAKSEKRLIVTADLV